MVEDHDSAKHPDAAPSRQSRDPGSRNPKRTEKLTHPLRGTSMHCSRLFYVGRIEQEIGQTTAADRSRSFERLAARLATALQAETELATKQKSPVARTCRCTLTNPVSRHKLQEREIYVKMCFINFWNRPA